MNTSAPPSAVLTRVGTRARAASTPKPIPKLREGNNPGHHSPFHGIDPRLEFLLRTRLPNGKRVELLYRPHTPELRWANTGESVSLKPVGLDYDLDPDRKWPIACAISPDNPGRKHLPIRALKIQMGLKCNYRCGYCNQTARPDDSHGNPALAREFLDKMPSWFEPPPDDEKLRIEFWGGEPFVYWKTMRLLGEVLRSRYPQALLNVVTNGSILDDEKIAWLEQHRVQVSVSHDGPGQAANRGGDPFDRPASAEALRKLYSRLRPLGLINFNCVLARNNMSLSAVRTYIAEKLGCRPEELPLATEEIVLPYEETGMDLSFRSKAESQIFKQVFVKELADGSVLGVLNIREKLRDFFLSLAKGRPSHALAQRCGMDREDTLAVDLLGNVLTCQNTAAGDGHAIGHVSDLGNARLDTARHWLTRNECHRCPVIQLCKGACMRLDGEQWRQACRNSFAYNIVLLKMAVGLLAGLRSGEDKNQTTSLLAGRI